MGASAGFLLQYWFMRTTLLMAAMPAGMALAQTKGDQQRSHAFPETGENLAEERGYMVAAPKIFGFPGQYARQ